jgi:FkbM family methyltransferase
VSAFLPDRILRLMERTVGAQLTYSQYGEDLIVDRALRNLGITRPAYLDIGAYSPTLSSNTALFYRRGLSGVCVEANPHRARALRSARPRDTTINAGVGAQAEDARTFYIMNVEALSTFSSETAKALEQSPEYTIEHTTTVKIVTAGDLIAEHFPAAPNFLSVDVEGDDLAVLRGIDFSIHRPEVICAETLTFSDEPENERKLDEINDLMLSNDYLVYADTRVNTIFVDGRKWRSRGYR